MACETFVTTGLCIVGGEITTSAYVDIPSIVRKTICDIGYDRGSFGYDGNVCGVMIAIDEQSPDIAQGVNASEEVRSGISGEDELDQAGRRRSGDDVRLRLRRDRRAACRCPSTSPTGWPSGWPRCASSGEIPYLRPDGKTQVTFEYVDGEPVALRTVLISTQHNDGIDRDTMIRPDLIEHVIRPTIPERFRDDNYDVWVNPTGRFVIGGPVGDAGLTGRKIIVDTYGGMARHGGGAFSGKDPSKVDRSAAYAARWVAKNVVASGAARRCEVQVAYAIGMARPISLLVETFGTQAVDPAKITEAVRADLRPAARRHHPRPRPAPADLPPDLGLRPLRAGRRLPLGADRPGRRTEVSLGLGLGEPRPPRRRRRSAFGSGALGERGRTTTRGGSSV